MLAVNWTLVIFTTVILYVGIFLMLPFNTVYATIILFGLISFWSRLPGGGLPQPYNILYFTDLVDFFSLIIAVNVGGFAGGMFCIAANAWAKVCSVYPGWDLVGEDIAGQFVVCLIIPFVHVWLGGDIFISMMAYTILRIAVILPFDALLSFTLYGHNIISWTTSVTINCGALFIINATYAKLFGKYFDSLLIKGVSFSWSLLLIATVVILIFSIFVFRFSPSKNIRRILRRIIKLFIRRKRRS